jgi:hypothetical protein
MGANAPAQFNRGAPMPASVSASMSANNYAFSLTPGGPSGARSLSLIAAAIAAVCVVSGMLVMQEVVGASPARANTAATALTSDFQSRWWPGEVRQVNLRGSIEPDNELTFAKGYAQRVAARQAAAAARIAASGPAAESQFGRSAMVVRKPTTLARADGAQPGVPAGRSDALADRRLDFGSHALAFGEQRPRGFAGSGLFGSLFGNVY